MPNVGSVSAELGLNTAKYEDGLRRASGATRSSMGEMSAEMKRQSREGAESLRLVGESIDLHMSRPLARVVAQIPGVGEALASLGGATVGGAGLFALGAFLIDKLAPAAEAVAQHFGLMGESADEAGKAALTDDEALIASLKRRTDMQEKYNKLVLGLKGVDLFGADIAGLEAQNRLLAQQLDLRAATVAQAQLAGNFDDKNQTFAQALRNVLSTITFGGVSRTGANETKAMTPDIEKLNDRMTELNDQIQTMQWESYREGVDEAFEAQLKFQRGTTAVNAALHELDLELIKNLHAPPAELAGFTAKAPTFQPNQNLPAPGAGSPAGAQFSAFQGDQAAQMKLAAAAYQDMVTPAQKYDLTIQELNLLLEKGLIDQAAFSAATIKAKDALAEATNQASKMQEALDKALRNTNSVSAGMRAFFLQMQIDAGQKGKFTFDIMTSAMKGFEDNMASLLVTGRAHWTQFFQGLETDLLKFAMNQTLMLILKQLAGMGGGTGGFFSNLLSGFGGGKASGGSVGPGMSYIVGEQGPEILSMGNQSGFITPNSGAGGSGGGVYIDARGADAGVEQRCLRAIQASEERMQQVGLRNVSEFQRRTIAST